MDINPIHMLLLDLEDHNGYVRDAKEELQSYLTEYGSRCPELEENLEEAKRQVEEIRKQIRELS